MNPQSALRTWCAIFALIGLGSSQNAAATDGTVTIAGEITATTCKIEGATPPHHLLVKLPTISTSALRANGDVAGATVFAIRLSECPSTATSMRAHFEPGLTTDYGSGNLIAYGATSTPTNAIDAIPANPGTQKNNVQIQLANLDGTKIQLGAASQGETPFNMTESGGHREGTLKYIARYVKKGSTAVTAGKLVTYVNYSLVYP